MRLPHIVTSACLGLAFCSCELRPPTPITDSDAEATPTPEPAYDHVLKVTATAYCNRRGRSHTKGAWGHKISPGMKIIAVSRDLLEHGLPVGTEVKIDGLPGTYRVKDKMGARWRKRIDIYMGDNRKAMHAWGKRKVTIRWTDPPSSS